MLKEITSYPVLKAQQNIALARDFQRHIRDAWTASGQEPVEDPRGQEIRKLGEKSAKVRAHLFLADRVMNDLVCGNARLVYRRALRYLKHTPTLPIEDLFQEGVLGLMRGIRGFDPDRGWYLSTYVTCWIDAAIGRAISDKARDIRLPTHVAGLFHRVKKQRQKLKQELGRHATDAEIEARVGEPTALINRTMEAGGATIVYYAPKNPNPEEQGNLLEAFSAPDAESARDLMERAEYAGRAFDEIGKLPAIQRLILTQRFGLGEADEKTLNEVGDIAGLSGERIRQLEVQALSTLRNRLGVKIAPTGKRKPIRRRKAK